MGYTENISSILKWGNSFQRQFDFPLDRTSMHSSYEDALAYAKGDASDERGLGKLAYIGQTITVWGLNEKGKEGVWVYSLVPHTPVDEADTRLADLKPVGSATTETANNYTAAKALSQGLAVGQLIQVADAEEVEETIEGNVVKNTYQAGFYIVNAPGSISALGTSSGADDEIGALETRVSSLEANKVAKTDFETYKGEMTTALDTKVDDSDFSEYQTTVSTALDAKVDNSALETYKGEMTTALDAKVDDSDFSEYQTTVSTALDTKATIEALNNLEDKVDVDIQNLTDHLVDFTGTVEDIDGRLDNLEGFVDAHIAHDAIEMSDIEGLFATKTE